MRSLLLAFSTLFISINAFSTPKLCSGILGLTGFQGRLEKTGPTSFTLDYRVGDVERRCVFSEAEGNQPGKMYFLYHVDQASSLNCATDAIDIRQLPNGAFHSFWDGRQQLNVFFNGNEESFYCEISFAP